MHLSWTDPTRPEGREFATPDCDIEDLLSRLSVQVEAFRVSWCLPEIVPCEPLVNQTTVLFVVEGAGSLLWHDTELALCEGTIALVPSRLPVISKSDGKARTQSVTQRCTEPPHCRNESNGNLTVATCVVSASAGHGLGYFENIERPLIDDSRDPLLGHIFKGILNELETPGIGSKCIVEALIKQVLMIMLRRILTDRTSATPLYLTIANRNLAQVINTIHNGHSERLSIPGLARSVGMTSVGLTREFEDVFGENLLDYIQGVRLHRATNLLTQTNLPIKCIAASVGYASRSHFSRAFRKHRGQDPTSFRKGATQTDAVLEAGHCQTNQKLAQR
jgi:AraC family transcriptional regulator, activator of mtrCDE